MSLIDENMAEQAALDWFEALGYGRVFGPDIAPDGPEQERESYKQVVLADPPVLQVAERLTRHDG